MYSGEEVMMTPEKCMSMLLTCMQKIAEKSQGAPVTDCVLTVIRTPLERHQNAITSTVGVVRSLSVISAPSL